MPSKQPIRVLVTGAAGQIAYSLIPMIARGDVFGSDQPIILHLLDIPFMERALTGVTLEVEDCAFPLVVSVHAFTQEEPAFKDIESAFLVGAMPRKKDMERKDLLAANVKIFASQGNALKQWAKPTCKVLVVGNPANTNALICAKFATPKIPFENITAMTRLDENRAKALLAKKNDVPVSSVENVIIWGNHSSTQFPDLSNALSNGNKLPFNGHDAELIEQIQKRGAKIIELRSLSSAMSAAKAAADHMKSFYNGSNGKLTCMGVYTGNSESSGLSAENRKLALEYGAEDNLIFSLPVTIDDATKQVKVLPGFKLDKEAKNRIKITVTELMQEMQEAYEFGLHKEKSFLKPLYIFFQEILNSSLDKDQEFMVRYIKNEEIWANRYVLKYLYQKKLEDCLDRSRSDEEGIDNIITYLKNEVYECIKNVN